MTAKYFHPLKDGTGKGNLTWRPAHPARNGRFPASHPIGPNSDVHRKGDLTMQLGDSPGLAKLRAAGYYWISLFPEGDGACFDTTKTAEETMLDFSESLGISIALLRGDEP